MPKISSKYQVSQAGFTLIELLIALSIIGIISAIIINSALAVRRASRDAQRKADLRTIQSVLQQYYADQNYFPLSGAGSNLDLSADGGSSFTNLIGNPASPTSKTYMEALPKDPNSATTPYCFKSYNSTVGQGACTNNSSTGAICHGYYLCTTLESSDPNAIACPADVKTLTGCANANYAVSPL